VSPYINPKYFWPPALFGLAFKIFLTIHCVFTVIYLTLRNRRFIRVCLLGFFISIPSISHNFAFHLFNNEAYNQKEKLRLMTYNCTSFGWFKNPDYDAILNNIRTADPDILCLQEYYKHTSKHKRILKFLRDELGYKHYYEYTTNIIQKSKNQVGQAYFSKIPLHNFTPVPFQEKTSNGASFVDIYLPNDTIRLVNVHFQSIRLHEDEYDLSKIKPLDEEKNGKEIQLFKSLQKLRGAFRRRSYQASLVDSVIESSPYKVIICGDFNDTPNSYIYNKIRSTLNDTYLETNSGVGGSFAGKIPGLRIDYILADPEIDVQKTFVWKHIGGQHYPLISDFNLQKP
jgi:endonuclease/exonuclease/phosphatase family metal-dependent hydrolase